MKKMIWSVLILATLMASAADNTPAAPGDVDAFSKQLDPFMEKLLEANMLPGAAVAILHKGEPIVFKGYGFADKEKRVPVTPETVFNIGSISKNVAAWGVMSLVEEGRLGLDDPVSKYLTRWQLPKTEFNNEGVTIRRLLSHTAGLSVHGYPGFVPKDARPSIADSLSGKGEASGATALVKTIMEPGTKFKYSGGGYTILQLVIEEVTGMEFSAFMTRRVLAPLGMNNSSYHFPKQVTEHLATPYDSFSEVVPMRRFTAEAAAGLNVSLNDFVRYARANIPKSAGGSGGNGVLKEATIAAMQQGTEQDKHYGLGYMEIGKGLNAWGHGGDNQGWHAAFGTIPESGDGFIIFTNGDGGGNVRSDLNCRWAAWIKGDTSKQCFRPRVSMSIYRGYATDGVPGAIKVFEALLQDDQKKDKLSESIFNNLGYNLLGDGNVERAIACFQFNIKAFPEAGNPHDSLAEAYMKQGRYQLAITHYTKAFELDPSNNNAMEMIAKIKKQMTH